MTARRGLSPGRRRLHRKAAMKRRSHVRVLLAVLGAVVLAGGGVATAVVAQAAADYAQGVTSLNATQVKVWFSPTTPAVLVDVHYLVNGANQQNFRMANNGGTWSRRSAT